MTLLTRLFRRPKKQRPALILDCGYYVGNEASFAFLEDPVSRNVFKVIELGYSSEDMILRAASLWATERGYNLTYRKLNNA
jgi:hypothetical protein